MPKHVFGDPTKAKKQTATIVGTGPYMLETFDRGNHIILKRNANWWGRSVPLYKGISNFDKIWFRYQSQDNLMLEMVKKGDLDFLDETAVTPEVYFKKAGGPEWGKTVFKEKVENQSPRSWIFIGWNLRSPIFSDKNTRVAMAYLMNRPFMIEKFRYNMSVPATGPWPYSSEYASPKVKAIPFDPKMAEQLLAKAGWSDSNHDGVLDKMIDGKLVDFRFTLIYGNPNNEKYYTLYKEDLRKSGIVMDMKIVEWNTLTKLVADEHKFDAFAMGWGAGGVDIDPKQIWHSKSQGSNGSNFIGYQNLEVDKLIDQGRQELDKKKRIKIMRAIYEKIAADAPYLFMFNDKYVTYIHTARMKSPKPTYKFGINTDAWWIQP
jgi:peptide/nickel transport system substrate-binding protein/microcin C transport system substrate-binding protein